MARTSLVDKELKVGVDRLTKQWRDLNRLYEDFARKKIEFAQTVATIWTKAQELDRKLNSDANQNHFRTQLREIIQSDNKSILSKWVGIGNHAAELLPYANYLAKGGFPITNCVISSNREVTIDGMKCDVSKFKLMENSRLINRIK